jgi:hypothetical protein
MNVRDNAMAYKVDGRSQAHLGGSLKAVYQAVVEETLPERVRNLLDALEGREMKPTGSRAVNATTGPRLREDGESGSSDTSDISLFTPQLSPRGGPLDEGSR